MSKYDFKSIEKKWQAEWSKENFFGPEENSSKKNFYVLDMFPYPSGNGLHVGHVEGYTATDIVVRKRRLESWNVLHPMGWDAFGLPAENYAIKTGVHPAESTAKNIENYRRQLKSLGFSYDWSREISTADPAYYRWTQWLFLFLYKNGLAYKGKAPVNWCDSCATVLANEQVLSDGTCERCQSEVRQKDLEQWFFRVTNYADRLLEDLAELDWPEKIKAMQVNWIGRSVGVEIIFVGEKDFSIPVFTTRADTLFGVSAVVLAPEHPLVQKITTPEQRQVVEDYIKKTRGKSELERTGTELEKSGVPTGATVQHPFTGKEVPIWIADYVLVNYGTGAVMCVPAHDQRDYEFAGKYGLPCLPVIRPENGEAPIGQAFTEKGRLFNSEHFDGLHSTEASNRIAAELGKKNLGQPDVKYHLRDWLISRQRYWGAPIPILYCDQCGELPVPEEQLPVLLPTDVDFRPTGESPLARSESFHAVNCPECGAAARRESDTMDTFVDSSWYFLRFCSPHEGERPFSSHAVAEWCPVDLYVGGAEHAVLHLLYARFFTKVLFDHGLIAFAEPFKRLVNPGLVLGENSEKMSKSRGNVVNPDDVVGEFGADALRLYEMFMGDFMDAKPWDPQGINGVARFLDRVWSTVHDAVHQERPEADTELTRLLHKTIRKVGDDIEAFKFNTAISALMILLNEWTKNKTGDKAFASQVVILLAPFAPHLAEELWHVLGNEQSVFLESWPEYRADLARDETVEVIVQVDGKMRDKMLVEVDTDTERLKMMALQSEAVRRNLVGLAVAKVIVAKGRLVNIVTDKEAE
ncbi:leucine--tRNA ligase [Patescibacteria group bacterium]|nr:leucine--tRNA ligase [Patescibacteria group bacterium]